MSTERKKILYPHNGELVQKCGKCPARIFFYKHPKSGKFIPVNAETLEPHFADCPAAAQFRKNSKENTNG